MGALSWCIHQRRNDRATVSMRIKRVHDENTERKKHKREREKGSNRKKVCARDEKLALSIVH